MSMKQQHTTHNHTKFHRQTKHFVAQPKEKTHKNQSSSHPHPSIIVSTKKKREKKIPQKIFPPQKWLVHQWFISALVSAATQRQIFRALKQAVKPSIQSWQNPTSVALNDFGAVRETGGKRRWMDGWMDVPEVRS